MVGDKARRQRVKVILNDWLDFFGLSHRWHIRARLVTELDGEAEVTILHPYRKANIIVRRGYIDMAPTSELEYSLVHEICHILIAPINTALLPILGNVGSANAALQDAQESVADELAKVFMRLRYGEGQKGVVIDGN